MWLFESLFSSLFASVILTLVVFPYITLHRYFYDCHSTCYCTPTEDESEGRGQMVSFTDLSDMEEGLEGVFELLDLDKEGQVVRCVL